MANMVLNKSGGSTVITIDPDEYRRRIIRQTGMRHLLNGDKSESLRSLRYIFSCTWNQLSEAAYEALRGLFFGNELIYWDDGSVPPLIETKEIYNTKKIDYTGIESGSSTHIAYTDSSPSVPGNEGDLETTEISTAEYQAIDGDDSNYLETTNPTAGYYLYHKFLFYVNYPNDEVRRLRLKIAASGDDESLANKDGVILYGWNQSNWQELTRRSNPEKNYLLYNAPDTTTAQSLVDSSDYYARFLLRTRAARTGTDGLTLRTYFAELEINENESMVITLSHTPTLSGGDVIWVKNLTDSTTLTLTTDYTISGKEVTIIGEDPGDNIEIKYNRDFEGMIFELVESWLAGDPSGDRVRELTMRIDTLIPDAVGS